LLIKSSLKEKENNFDADFANRQAFMRNFKDAVINNPLNGDFWKQKESQIYKSDFLRDATGGPADEIRYHDFNHLAGRSFMKGSG